jgi:glucose/arabinose dehydrogenase
MKRLFALNSAAARPRPSSERRMRRIMRFVRDVVTALVVVSAAAVSAAAQSYVTAGDCDGFPRVDLKSMPGSCVGLVAAHLGFARGVVAIGDDIYVADMGGWRKGHGRLLRLAHDGHAAPLVVLDRLDEPNAIALGPSGTLYLGLLGKVVQVDPAAENPATSLRDVLVKLPSGGRHPLPALAMARDGSLFVNVGSATDHCETEDDSPPNPAAICPETSGAMPRATIIRVPPSASPIDASTLSPYARGLRNSMALAVLPSGELIAAVNARDFIDRADASLSDEDLPHDTYDRVEQGADYGWPYCYDDNVPSPEYPHFDCTSKHKPTLLLPAHAAPLGMLYYHGDALPALKGELIIGLHGYRAQGHRLVALAVDEHGVPTAPPSDVISGWGAAKGKHPQGAPVAVFETADGSVLVTEDHNGTLLRLARSRE